MFFLGIFQANFLDPRIIPPHIPLMIARRHLASRRTLPDTSTRAPWVLDSGGFNDITLHGQHRTTPLQYTKEIRRFRSEMPHLAWAAPQDWMCEVPALLRTGLSVEQHQHLTTQNYIELRILAPDLPIIPVLQGHFPDDYFRHLDLYSAPPYRIDLDPDTPLVGIGSVCRRQSTEDILHVLRPLASLQLRLHGFGMKTTGLQFAAHLLTSADSAAWSRAARYDGHRPLCTRPTSRHHGRPFQPAQCPSCAEIFYNSLHHHFPDNPPLPQQPPQPSGGTACPSPFPPPQAPSALPPPAPSRTEPAVTADNASSPPPNETDIFPAPNDQPPPPRPCLPAQH